MFRELTLRNGILVLGILGIAVGFAYHVSGHPMDFRVYHYGARGVFDGTRPVYGLTSGLGWPMHYRYPPLFLLLFAPFAWLPLGAASAVWVFLKIAVLVWLVQAFSIRERAERGVFLPRSGEGKDEMSRTFPSPGLRPSSPGGRRSARLAAFIPLLFIAPYVIEEFRYGNAQFFVFALTAAAFLILPQRPRLAAAALALAICIKVWPLFFLPYLAVKRDWKVVTYSLLFVLLLTFVPSFYFGVSGNARLIGEWFNQEFHTQLNENEIWFPNQSLRGVLMRYLTVIDYSQVPDANYPQVNVASLNASSVRLIWMVLAGAAYAGFLFLANQTKSAGRLEVALAFCLLAILEPFTQKYALIVLLWPALAAVDLMKDQRVRIFIWIAAVLALVQPLAPGASAQRLLQVLGLDFAAATLLTTTIFVGYAANRNRTLTIR